MTMAVGSLAVSSTANGQVSKPGNLRAEYRVNPLGIDVASPRLSWEISDPRRGALQSAHQVIVSTDKTLSDPKAVVWDTGKVESDQSIHVAYEGKPAASSDLIADSRPEPGPFTSTDTLCKPKSIAFFAASDAACCAANGVLFRDPLKPTRPEVDHVITLPKVSVIVIKVLLNEALI